MPKEIKQNTYESIREAIINGVLKPGQAITEEWLSNYLSVSRTPVREAFIRLQSEGLVRIVKNKGAFVREITSVDIGEIFQIRKLLESFAAKACVDFIEVKEIGEIKDELEELSLLEGHVSEKVELGIKLHKLIMESAGNHRLTYLVGMLSSQILWVRSLAQRIPGRVAKSINEHINIANAVYSRDKTRAEKCMMIHLDNVMKDILDVKNIQLFSNLRSR